MEIIDPGNLDAVLQKEHRVSEVIVKMNHLYDELNDILRRNPEEQPFILSAKDAFELLKYPLGLLQHEEMWSLNLNTKLKLISICRVAIGSPNSINLNSTTLLRQAVIDNATGIIIAHNHPSGSLYPSSEDIAMTEYLAKAANYLDITLSDHLIITQHDFTSLHIYCSVKPERDDLSSC